MHYPPSGGGTGDKMTQKRLLSTLACLMFGSAAIAGENLENRLKANLNGFQEVPARLSNGTGTFTATLNATSLTFSFSFSNLSSSATGAFIYFGQRGVVPTTGAFVIICGQSPKPVCPAGGSTLAGTITGADVFGGIQGITTGSFADLVRILRSGNAYVNVLTTGVPQGEIRGQISLQD
jgi:hypothetical protein